MIGREAVDRGRVDEHRVVVELVARGWGCVPFGQGAWNPDETPGFGNAAVLAAIRATHGALRHAPDILTARGTDTRFVEVVNCGTWERRALELAKMEALSEWAHIAPVWVVDVSDWRTWRHVPGWAYEAVSDVSRDGRGSGDPWCLYRRRGRDAAFTEVFG